MNALRWQCGLLHLYINIATVLSVNRTFIAKSVPLGFLRAQHHRHHGDLVASGRRGTVHNGELQATTAGRQCCPTSTTAAESLRCKAILLCGGVSQRMNGQLKSLLGSKNPDFSLPEDCPPYKQFISMHGVPLFVYSLAEFLDSPLVAEVTIATKPEWNSKVLQLVDSTAGILLSRRRQLRQKTAAPAEEEDAITTTTTATTGITASTITSTTTTTDDDNDDNSEPVNIYDDHLRRFPFFFYDLTELRCVLCNSPSWDEAVERAVKMRDDRRYKVINLCVSGDHRAETVYNALRRKNALDARLPGCCREEYIALVHDAVRPLTRHVEMAPLIAEARRHGAAVPAVGVVDTIKVGSPSSSSEKGDTTVTSSSSPSSTTFVTSTPDRSTLFAIQTPQAFKSSLLTRAYATVLGEEGKDPPVWLTDDASFVEHLGSHRVAIVPGHRLNMKVTTWEDIRVCCQHLKDTYFPDA